MAGPVPTQPGAPGPLPAAEPGADRILTIPNAVTVIRLLFVPVFVWLLFGHHPHERYAAAWVLAALGATDWVDGYLARRLHQVSTVGKVLDPTADRILLGTAVIAVIVDGAVPLWIGLLVLIREVLVAGAVLILAGAGARRIDVQWAGKAGTFGLMFAFPFFLVAHSNAGWHRVAEVLAWCCALPAICFSLYAAVTYVPLGRKALADGRADRLARAPTPEPHAEPHAKPQETP